MQATEAQVRKWGRSAGIVIPREILEKEGIRVNDKVEILVRKKANPLKRTFGTLKFREPINKILKEVDEDLWND